MKTKLLVVAILAAAIPWASPRPASAECNPTCAGDWDLDDRVTVDEIVAVVNNALADCGGGSAEQRGCVASGGSVSMAQCCSTAPDFPETCGIGACGCAPQFSHEVSICDCPFGQCFDRSARACLDQ
jgi:hypothetical protein